MKFFIPLITILLAARIVSPAVRSEEAPAETLAPEYLQNVLVVQTDRGAGTGFLCVFKGKLFVATNQHVIEGTKSLSIQSPSGEKFQPVNFIAARNADIVLIGVPPGAVERRPLQFAENIESVAAKGDPVLVAGNSKGDGVITVTPGSIVAVGPTKLEVDSPVFPGNSGGPIFHVKTKQIIALLTEASVVSLDDAVEAASFQDDKSQIKNEVRYFGHRVDTATGWYALNLAEFRSNSALISKGQNELNGLLAFFSPERTTDWKTFRDLHDAVNRADQALAGDKLSDADKTRALQSLNTTLKSLSTRGVREVTARKKQLTFAQLKDLEEMERLSDYVTKRADVLARDLEKMRTLMQKGRR